MTLKMQHEWTAETIGEAVELWRRLVNVYAVSAYEHCEVASGSHYPRYVASKDLTDEWVTALVLSDGERVELPADGGGYRPYYSAVELSLISYSDHSGTDYDAANVRALADYPGVTTTTDGRMGEGSATVMLGEMPRDHEGVTGSLAHIRKIVEIMEALERDTALIDDDVHTAYIDGLAEEAWSQYLDHDVPAEVREILAGLIGDDDAADDAVDAADADAIRDAFYGYQHPNGEAWQAETATSVRHVHHADAVRHVVRIVFSHVPGARDLAVKCECPVCHVETTGQPA